MIEDAKDRQVIEYAVLIIKDNGYWLLNIAVHPTHSDTALEQ